jgi:hypothetical protein
MSHAAVPLKAGQDIHSNNKLQSCHCEEPFDCAQDKLHDVAIYDIEPALVRDTNL